MSGGCQFCWGSHCCDLPGGHLGAHQCGDRGSPCSQFDEPNRAARYMGYDDNLREVGWSEWMPSSSLAPTDDTGGRT